MNSLKNDKLKSWGLTSSRNTSYLQFTMFVTETDKGLFGYELVWNEKRFSKFFEFVHCRLLLQRQEGALFHQEIQLPVDLLSFYLTLTCTNLKFKLKFQNLGPVYASYFCRVALNCYCVQHISTAEARLYLRCRTRVENRFLLWTQYQSSQS